MRVFGPGAENKSILPAPSARRPSSVGFLLSQAEIGKPVNSNEHGKKNRTCALSAMRTRRAACLHNDKITWTIADKLEVILSLLLSTITVS